MAAKISDLGENAFQGHEAKPTDANLIRAASESGSPGAALALRPKGEVELYSGKSSANADRPASDGAAHPASDAVAHPASTDAAESDPTSGEAGRSWLGRIGDAVGRFFFPDRVREAKAAVADRHAGAVNVANLKVEAVQGEITALEGKMNAAGWEARGADGLIQQYTAEFRLGYGRERPIARATRGKEQAETHMRVAQAQLEDAQGSLRDTEAARDRVIADNKAELSSLSGWRHPFEAIRSYFADQEELRAFRAEAALREQNASLSRPEQDYSRGNQFETRQEVRIPLDEV